MFQGTNCVKYGMQCIGCYTPRYGFINSTRIRNIPLIGEETPIAVKCFKAEQGGEKTGELFPGNISCAKRRQVGRTDLTVDKTELAT